MSDLSTATVTTRIEGIKAAVSRSRVAFLVSTIISLSVIFGVWNRYFAWDREYAMQAGWTKEQIKDFPKDFPTKNYLQQQLLSQWVQDQQIASSFFGIRVSASDATFLASCALAITLVWFYWCTRLENHSIGTLLRDTSDEKQDQKALIFYGIIANLIFIHLSGDDRAISSLKPPSSPKRRLPLLHGATTALLYLPTFTILFSGLVQLWFLTKPSPFDPSPDLYPKHTYRWVYVLFVLAMAVAGLIITSISAYKINSFRKGITSVLKEYFNSLALKQKIGGERDTCSPLDVADGNIATET